MARAMDETQPDFGGATGKLKYTLTNDYLFRALLQQNNEVLRRMTCSLMHLRPEEVKTVSIVNPVVLGNAIDEKTYILDIKVLLNGGSIVNYEMQVMNWKNWPERSLLYLCRLFDELHRGQKYLEVKPVAHIGILDYTLFTEVPEFFATYRMMNEKNYHIYTDKFTLCVVDLNCINLATEEDRKWGIDSWAALFKATTWEEINMLAEKNETMRQAAEEVYRLTQDKSIREQCRAREDYYRLWNTVERDMLNMNAELQMRLERIEAQTAELEELSQKIGMQKAELEEKTQKIGMQKAELEEKTQKIGMQKAELEEKTQKIGMQKAELEEKTQKIGMQEAELEEKTQKIGMQKAELEAKSCEIERLKRLLAEREKGPSAAN